MFRFMVQITSVRKNPNELPVTDGSERVFRRFLGVSIGNWGGFSRALSGEGSPLNAGQTLFSQLLDCLPWSRFTRIVTRHGGDRWVQTFPGSEQYRAMAFVQLTFRESLRDIEACLSAQPGKLWPMGFRGPLRRSTLADANEKRDWRIYAAFACVDIG